LQRDRAAGLGTSLGRTAGLVLDLHGFRVEFDVLLLEQELQLKGDFIPQVEQAVARMMGMETELGTVCGHSALGTHHEGSGTSVAELEFALSAGEMHASAPVQVKH